MDVANLLECFEFVHYRGHFENYLYMQNTRKSIFAASGY